MELPVLIVNLSENAALVNDVANKFGSGSLRSAIFLDVTGVTPNDFSFTRIYAREYDPEGRIEQASITDYVESIGSLGLTAMPGGDQIRSIAINGLPIFWITELSQKHPFKHWGATLFYFKHLIANQVVPFEQYQEVIVLASLPASLVKDVIDGFGLFKGKKVTIKGNGEKKLLSTVYQLKSFASFYKQYHKLRQRAQILKKRAKPDLPSSLMISLSSGSYQSNPLIKTVAGFLEKKSSFAFLNLPDILVGEATSEKVMSMVSKAVPDQSSVFKLFSSILSTRRQVRKRINASAGNWLLRIALFEMHNAASRTVLLFYHQWLINLFEGINDSVKLYYEDEAYITGRVISHAASRNKHINKIGYQHGNIAINHTVYCISQHDFTPSAEKANDSLPFPDYFLFWGDHFKNQFLRYNSFDKERLITAGNLQHILLRQQQSDNNRKHNSPATLLWCTTNLELAKLELDLFRHILEENKQLKLIIRMHPLIDISADLRKELNGDITERVTWGEKIPIYEQLKQVDLLICSAHSSVFFDAIIQHVPTIRIFTPYFMKENIKGSDILWNIATRQEMEIAVEQAIALAAGSRDPKKETLHSYIFSSDTSVWDRIVTGERC